MAKNKKDKVKNKFSSDRWVVKELCNNEYLIETKDGLTVNYSFKSALDMSPKFFKSKIKAKIAMKWYIFEASNKEGFKGKRFYQLFKVCVPKPPK